MQKIILASNSKQRAIILETLKIPFTIIPANIQEKAIRHTKLKKQVTAIAQAKAQFVAHDHSGIIIAADTFNVVDTHVFEKPKDKKHAFHMLEELSGKESVCYTGYCYIDEQNKIFVADAVTIRVRFRDLSKADIMRHVQTHPVTQWAAGFSPAYTDTLHLVSSVQGSLTGFSHGLPLERIIPLLKKSGFFV